MSFVSNYRKSLIYRFVRIVLNPLAEILLDLGLLLGQRFDSRDARRGWYQIGRYSDSSLIGDSIMVAVVVHFRIDRRTHGRVVVVLVGWLLCWLLRFRCLLCRRLGIDFLLLGILRGFWWLRPGLRGRCSGCSWSPTDFLPSGFVELRRCSSPCWLLRRAIIAWLRPGRRLFRLAAWLLWLVLIWSFGLWLWGCWAWLGWGASRLLG